MASARQIAANRRNAQKCTGPITEQGKAVSRFNGLKHGLTAASVCLPYENQIGYQELRAQVVEDFLPENPMEWMLVDQLASAWWRTIRARKVEGSVMNGHTKTLAWKNEVPQPHGEAANFEALGVAMAVHDESSFNNYHRYESSIERAFYRAYDRLNKIAGSRKRNRTASYSDSETPSSPGCPELGLVSLRSTANHSV
jgi:hypothetical protein